MNSNSADQHKNSPFIGLKARENCSIFYISAFAWLHIFVSSSCDLFWIQLNNKKKNLLINHKCHFSFLFFWTRPSNRSETIQYHHGQEMKICPHL